jgi:DNA-binding transcriptional ArsR family regulator
MDTYEMMLLYKELGLPESFFLTREKGEKAYQILADQLKVTPNGHPLLVIFPPNQLMDASFADESIIRLGEAIIADDFGDRCILLQGLTSDSITNLEAAISLRKLKLAFLSVEPTGAWNCIGQLEPSLLETLTILAVHTPITAPELADMKGLAINSASNRLKRLYDQRLVRREHEISEKGLQYIYYFWNWSAE